MKITTIELADGRSGYRFVSPILYAGKSFGLIEVNIANTELEAARKISRDVLLALGGILLLVVAGMSFSLTKLIARPVNRLKRALRDATMGDLDFRLSHGRNDEFGELFDAFNLFASTMQSRMEAAVAEPARAPASSLEATRIDWTTGQANLEIPDSSPDAVNTPFDRLWRQHSA